jgi:zinc D-Ala-D-Ala carboxypeptidase
VRSPPRQKILLFRPAESTGKTELDKDDQPGGHLSDSRPFRRAPKIYPETKRPMKLSANFTLNEFIQSRTAKEQGLDNFPSDHVIQVLRFTAAGMERIRACLDGAPIHITSAYRSIEVNDAVGGEKFSQHVKGEAVDFICPAFGTPREIAFHLHDKLGMLGVDQMILEGTWIHVSFTLSPRREMLTLSHGKYLKGVV